MLDPMPALPQDPPVEAYPSHVIDGIERSLAFCPFDFGQPYLEDSALGWNTACDCGARGPVKDNPYEAAAAWNYRPTERRATKRPFNISGHMGVM